MFSTHDSRAMGIAVGVLLFAAKTVSIVQAESFDLQSDVSNPAAFTPNQLEIVSSALAAAEARWEEVITGYRSNITLTGISITLRGITSGFASAAVTGSTQQEGRSLSTNGAVSINVDLLEEFSNYENSGLNFIDDILAHEIGHILGIGTMWVSNDLYELGSGEYLGTFGVAAFRREFDSSAVAAPVELAGSGGTANTHWDQIMRSSVQEGDPNDPFALSPLLGIVDHRGRDLALELMTGAIDPDFGEPFLSRTSVESLRDLGFTVRAIPEPATWALLLLGVVFAQGLPNRSVCYSTVAKSPRGA